MECAVRLSHVKSITNLMRPLILVREPQFIVSMLHHFFKVHRLGEQDVHLHVDNCGGQNKNNAMVGYLLWRVLTGLYKNIILSFMITGHTKFSPDWCFGLLKKR